MSSGTNETTTALHRLENILDKRFDKMEQEIKEVKAELREVNKELSATIRNNFLWTLVVIVAVLAIRAH